MQFSKRRLLKKPFSINGFRVYPVLYDMPLKDCKSEMVKAKVWEKNCAVSSDNVSVLLTFSMSKNFASILCYMYIVEETSRCCCQKRTRNRLVRP